MKAVFYMLCVLVAIQTIVIKYCVLRLRDTEARRKRAAAKVIVLLREKRQHFCTRDSAALNYERMIEELEQRLDEANKELESMKRTKHWFGNRHHKKLFDIESKKGIGA